MPPNAAPIDWCPKQTPSIGTDDAFIKSIEMPASFGVQGPGEITILLGLSEAISSRLTSSFLFTITSLPSSPI